LRVICLNAWGGKFYDRLISYLQDASPDVLCLQEVVHSPTSNKEWLVYRDGSHVLEQRANLFADVSKVLPEHHAVFCPAAQGVLWEAETPVLSQWGLATFVRRSLTIVGQMQGFVHKQYSSDGFGEHPRSRSAHAVRVFDHQSGSPITIAHMHGLRDLNGKMDTPARLEQARKLACIVQSVSQPDDRVVVCGDFNVEPDSETFDVLSQIGLFDLVKGSGSAGTRTSYYRNPGAYADYMLVNKKTRVRRFSVVHQPEVSDHCPLLLDI
jgi:endonuclease/exonuclease/phosphatase family metal-dependent hydrolase